MLCPTEIAQRITLGYPCPSLKNSAWLDYQKFQHIIMPVRSVTFSDDYPGIDDYAALAQWCKSNGISLGVVGPEDPLANGIADELCKNDIPTFGPKKAAAQIEASKVFSKTLMDKYNIPTAKWQSFDDPQSAKDYINR